MRWTPIRSLGLGGALLVSVLGFRARVGGPLVVSSRTLSPTVEPGTWVWVWKCCGSPRAGDAVWARWPGTEHTGAYRVAAVGPSTVAVDAEGVVHVNGEPVQHSDRAGLRYERWGKRDIPVVPGGPIQEPIAVPSEHVFLLSDVRPAGGDGRVHGVIPAAAVLGTLGFARAL